MNVYFGRLMEMNSESQSLRKLPRLISEALSSRVHGRKLYVYTSFVLKTSPSEHKVSSHRNQSVTESELRRRFVTNLCLVTLNSVSVDERIQCEHGV